MPSAKVSPNECKRGVLSKMLKIKVNGNKQVPIVLRAIFSNYDKDGSGTISLREMCTLVLDLQSLLPGTPDHLKHCADTVSKIAMKTLDLDNNGTIDEDEFVEWCQQNLFLSKEDRSALLVQNPDLSQFMTALEMCIKMQLAGIGPYSYYTPPPQPLGKNIVSHTSICAVGAAYVFLFFFVYLYQLLYLSFILGHRRRAIYLLMSNQFEIEFQMIRIAQYQVSIPLYLYVGMHEDG